LCLMSMTSSDEKNQMLTVKYDLSAGLDCLFTPVGSPTDLSLLACAHQQSRVRGWGQGQGQG
jgi:hypothetical protein